MDVLTVDDYGTIRRARRDGMSIRRIAREFRHSRYKIRRVLEQAEPEPYPQTRNRRAPILGPMHAVIDQILADDEDAPRKQRHTAAQIYRRLREEHAYLGGYAQVQRYVRNRRQRHQETFIPLSHLPGQRLEADFGHIHVDFPDGRRLVPFLVTAWAYSNAPFVLALPFERTEAILEGMVAALEFFGAVPRQVWWDNPKTVATLILQGRQREIHPHYKALASHYVFDPQFCMPGRGNEKPDAESTVKAVQRRFATPVPRVADLAELNALFRQRCMAEQERVVQSLFGPFTIKDRFAEELRAAAPLPRHRFDPCVTDSGVVADKYQSVAFDRNRYSVPRRFAFQSVTVKGYVDRVVIVAQGQVIAIHPRSLEKQKMILDPIHYLATLGCKPGALDHSPVFRDWKLPQCFGELRVALEERHGSIPGARRFVQVLQLLAGHPLTRVRRAIEECVRANLLNAEAVIERAGALAAIEALTRNVAPLGATSPVSAEVQVPVPDLSRFDELLLGSRGQNDPRSKVIEALSLDESVAGPVSVFCT